VCIDMQCRKIASALYLVLEQITFVVRPVSTHPGKIEFYEHIYTKLLARKLPFWAEAYASVFVLSSALSRQAYEPTLAMVRGLAERFPWKETSLKFMRRLFEVSLIFGDRDIALQILNESASRGQTDITRKMGVLLRWRFEGLIPKELAPLNLSQEYFEHFREYDEYFKGAVSEQLGNIADAREHFQRSRQFAPSEAREFRDGVDQRIGRLPS
jgi:hypothetical protein